MSISTEIARIQSDRNTIRTKLVDLGLVTSTASLDDCATAVDGITNRGSVSATVQEGDTYTIPAGYHNGSGTVSGVAGGGNYSLQSKTITPTKSQQAITPDSGYYGLSDVTVGAIPDNYQDVTPVTAGAADVLANKIIVDATGKTIAGTMTNNGAVSKTLDTTTTSYTVPAGYHNGSGVVKVVNETKTVTPTKLAQTITPASGKVLSSVNVEAIPDNYQDVTGVNVTADKVLNGFYFVDPTGAFIKGTMADNGAFITHLSLGQQAMSIPAGYHNGSGYIRIYPDAKKTVTPTKRAQTIEPDSDTHVLSTVVVEAIPDAYQDVTGVTATAAGVLDGYYFVNASGTKVEGTMTNRGAVTATVDGLSVTSYIIPAGYHNGTGTVSLTDDIETQLAAI